MDGADKGKRKVVDGSGNESVDKRPKKPIEHERASKLIFESILMEDNPEGLDLDKIFPFIEDNMQLEYHEIFKKIVRYKPEALARKKKLTKDNMQLEDPEILKKIVRNKLETLARKKELTKVRKRFHRYQLTGRTDFDNRVTPIMESAVFQLEALLQKAEVVEDLQDELDCLLDLLVQKMGKK